MRTRNLREHEVSYKEVQLHRTPSVVQFPRDEVLYSIYSAAENYP